MGGDRGPAVVVPAAIRFLDEHPDVEFVLFGLQEKLLKYFPNNDPTSIARCRVQFCSQVVTDNEQPSSALRHKQDSSMWLALQAVAQGQADACVSSGNTGALMAMGLKHLGVNAGLDRPAICTALPARTGGCYLLDLGANVDCSPKQLHQFALMATAMVSGLDGLAKPTVGLLNIGVEASKGNRLVKEAAELLSNDSSLTYRGYLEADEILDGRMNIVVCDGFVGNIALKATEGVARNVVERLTALHDKLMHDVGAKNLAGLLDGLRNALDPAGYNGAILLGLNRVVIKSHGNTDDQGFCRALERAVRAVMADVPGLVADNMNNYNRAQN